MSAATATAAITVTAAVTATANESVANKTCISKRKIAVVSENIRELYSIWSRNTKGSLSARW